MKLKNSKPKTHFRPIILERRTKSWSKQYKSIIQSYQPHSVLTPSKKWEVKRKKLKEITTCNGQRRKSSAQITQHRSLRRSLIWKLTNPIETPHFNRERSAHNPNVNGYDKKLQLLRWNRRYLNLNRTLTNPSRLVFSASPFSFLFCSFKNDWVRDSAVFLSFFFSYISIYKPDNEGTVVISFSDKTENITSLPFIFQNTIIGK